MIPLFEKVYFAQTIFPFTSRTIKRSRTAIGALPCASTLSQSGGITGYIEENYEEPHTAQEEEGEALIGKAEYSLGKERPR